MSLANPTLLWALPLGLIPIVIYYLLRFRALRVVWGANYVLELALERLKRRLHWDQILLIALRVAACLLLVVAFARPILLRHGTTVFGGGVHHVVVLDASYSMLAGSPGNTRWDRSMAVLRRLVATWGRGERWSLLLLDRRPHWVVDGRRVESAEESLAAVAPLEPAETAASLSAAFGQIAERVTEGRAEIYLFADDQATTWRDVESTRLPAELDAEVYWVCPPLAERTNVAVTSVRPAVDRPLQGHPQRIFVSLKSYAPEPIDELPVELLIDGVFEGRKSVALLPGQQTMIHFDVRFDEPGSHYLTARVADDALRFDDAASAGVEVVEAVRVLVLRDAAKQGKFQSAWGFFQVARRAERLAREEAGGPPAGGPGAGEASTAIEWTLDDDPSDTADWADADVVYLDGGCTLTPELVERLADFVGLGGGLVLASDPSVDPGSWNSLLGRAGLLPAPLGSLRVEQIGGERFRSLSRTDFDALPLKAFETEEQGDLSHAKFYSWFALRPHPEQADVLVRFDDQTPWLVRQVGRASSLPNEKAGKMPAPRGLGRVLLVATGVGGRGHNLFVREFAVPLLTAVFQEAAAGRIYPRTVSPGEPIRVLLPDTATLSAVTFEKGVGSLFSATSVPWEPVSREKTPDPFVTVSRPDLDSGLYRLLATRDEGSRPVWIGVQGRRVDSDLTPLGDGTRAAVAERLGVAAAADWEQLDQLLAAARTGREWHPWVIALALGVLVGEMLLQRRFAPQRRGASQRRFSSQPGSRRRR